MAIVKVFHVFVGSCQGCSMMNKFRRKISKYLEGFDEMVREDSSFCVNTLYFGSAMIIILSLLPVEISVGIAILSFLVMVLCIAIAMWDL